MDVDDAAALRQADPIEVGRRIRNLRLTRKMTQAQVAGGDMSIAYVSRIESGGRRGDLQTIETIARRLGTTVYALATGADAGAHAERMLSVRYAELALEQGEAVEAEQTAAALLAADTGKDPDLAADAAYVHARALEVLGRVDDAIVELEQLRDPNTSRGRWPSALVALCRC
jgi:transcriptional regulator with XRE-family HTH domain